MAQEEDPSEYLNRLAKHPRLSRNTGPSTVLDQVNAARSKQPRALEDGNWVCDDPNCGNVNYPRRTECNKCGKKRGALGNAVVKAYVDTIKMARGELPGGMFPSEVLGTGSEHLQISMQGGMGRGMLGHIGEAGQQGMHGQLPGGMLQEHDIWTGGSYEAFQQVQHQQQSQEQQQQQQQAPAVAAQYVAGDGGRRSTLSAASEGKRLAEQLVAGFAASSDPIGDAGECLASAALWLQTMKSRMQQVPSPLDMPLATNQSLAAGQTYMAGSSGYSSINGGLPGGGTGGVSGRGLSSGGSPAAGGALPRFGGFGDGTAWPGTATILPSVGGLQGLGTAGVMPSVNGTGILYAAPSLGPVSFGSRGPSHSPSGTVSGRVVMPRPAVKFEDYKDRPSDYLREFGDPAAVNAAGGGGGGNQRPEPGVNGNWECEDCKNVNFPRRTSCFQCHKKRGQKGEEVVREYVRRLIEGI